MVANRHGDLDLWLALLAGDRVWLDDDTPPALRERAVASFMIATLAGTVLIQWVALAARPDFLSEGSVGDASTRIAIVAAGGLLAAAALAIRPVRTVAGHVGGAAPYAWSIAWRAAAYFVLIAGTAAILPRARWIGAVPLGLVGGADALLALWALRIRPRVQPLMRRFLTSTLHLGAIGALAALGANHLIGGGDRNLLTVALSAYAAMLVGIMVAGVAVVAMDRLESVADLEREEERAQVIAAERSQRAHWLHDDVLSEVRYTTMRVGSEQGAAEVRRELEDLDHRLRLRQLDEVVRGGGAHLYEILQPHLRRLQTLGVTVDRVPPLEVTEQRVDEATSVLLNRALAVLTSNAVNAGARHVSMYLYADLVPPHLELRVIDDAGGFDLDAVPEGRGLYALRRDLGGDGLVREEAASGSCMIALIPVAS